MAELRRVQTDYGTILVEVSSADNAREVSAASKIIDAAEKLGDGLNNIVAVAKGFAGAVVKIGKAVKKAEMEIGLELTAEGNFFVASAGAKATFTAKLEFDLSGK